MEQLKVGIGADTKGLEKGLKDAEKALSTFATRSKQIEAQLKKNAIESSKLGAEISKLELDYKKGTISQSDFGKGMLKLTNAEKTLSNESKVLRSDLAKLNASSRDLGTKGMGAVKKGMVSGSSASIAFSRTIQDMPFGLMGVSNNITNLTEQFGYLKKQTGSASGALKAMLRDLKGFGGITLAISLVTSAMLVFGDTLFKTKSEAEKLKEEQDKLTESLDNYVNSLDAAKKAELDGGKSATRQLVNLQLLKAQLDDTSLSEKKRVEALDELKKLYPSYFKNISKDAALSKSLGENYNRLTKTIDNKAKADASANVLAQETNKQLVLQSQLEVKKRENAKKQLAVEATRTALLASSTKKETASAFAADAYAKAKEESNQGLKEEKEIIDRIAKSQENVLLLSKQIKENGGVVPLSFDIEESAVKGTNKKAVSLFDLTGVSPENVEEDIEVLKTTMYDSLATINEGLLGIGIDWSAVYKEREQIEAQEKLKANLMMLNESLSNIVNNGIANTLSGIGQAIGSALSTGANVADALGSALLGALGGVLTQLGEMAIAIGVGLIAIKLAFESLNPFAAIAAGIALVALGSFFSNGAKSIGNSIGGSGGSSSSSGGGSYSAPNVGSGYSAPSSRGGSSGYSGGGTVVFEIAGQKLVGVLSNTLARNKNLGGTLSIGG